MSRTILVVDDESDMELLIRQKFRRQINSGELIMHFAGNGEEALALLAKESGIEMLMTDINMPVMDGFGFLDNYEQLPEEVKRRCSIIMISSSNSQDDFARIKTYPSVRKFFSKPLSDIILDDIRMNVPVVIPS